MDEANVIVGLIVIACLTALSAWKYGKASLLWYFLPLFVLVCALGLVGGGGVTALAGLALTVLALFLFIAVTIGLLAGFIARKL